MYLPSYLSPPDHTNLITSIRPVPGRLRAQNTTTRPTGLRMLYDYNTPQAFPQIQVITQRAAHSYSEPSFAIELGSEKNAPPLMAGSTSPARRKQEELAAFFEQNLMQTRW